MKKNEPSKAFPLSMSFISSTCSFFFFLSKPLFSLSLQTHKQSLRITAFSLKKIHIIYSDWDQLNSN